MKEVMLTQSQVKALHDASKKEEAYIRQHTEQLRCLSPYFRAYVVELLDLRGDGLRLQMQNLQEAMNTNESQRVEILEWQRCVLCDVFTKMRSEHGTGLCCFCSRKDRK